jgi:type I restriction enzyme S subunit
MALLDSLEIARTASDEVRRAARDAALADLRNAPDAEAVEAAWSRIARQMDDLFFEPEDVGPLRQAVLQLAVRARLVPQDPADEPAIRMLERVAIADGRTIADVGAQVVGPWSVPRGWMWVEFGQTHINRDRERIPLPKEVRETRKGPFAYYGASGVIDSIDDFLFDEPLLLLGEDGANLVMRSTPIAFLATGKYWVNNHAHVLDSIEFDSLRYLAVFINATDLRPYLTGSAQPKLNQRKMNGIPCAFPPLAEQRRIVAKVDALMAKCDDLESRLTAIRDLQSAFAGAAVHHLEV